MKYYTNELIKLLIKNTNTASKSTKIIRLDNYPHPKIYSEISSFFVNYFEEKEVPFIAKLSYGKYCDFSSLNDLSIQNALENLKKLDFIDFDNHMTNWRNKSIDDKSVLFMMGTEAVEDRGGLADFFSFSPNELEKHIENKIASWFLSIVPDLSDLELQAINKYFNTVFRHVEKDYLKISSIVEELKKLDITTSEEILECLFSRHFADWGLPNVKDITQIPTILDINNGRPKIKIIEKSVKYKNRQDFKDGLTDSKFGKYMKQFEQFEEQKLKELTDVNFLPFDDYSHFKKVAVDYIKGINIFENRQLLCQCDFIIIDKIMQIKIGGSTPAKKDPKINGNTLQLIAKTILSSIKTFEEKASIYSIDLELSDISLANCTNDDDLNRSWNEVCIFSDGILEFICNANWLNTDEEEIKFKWKTFDPFEISSISDFINSGLIKKTAQNKKFSSARLVISLVSQTQTKEYDYIWEFAPNATWLYTFSTLFDQYENVNYKDSQSYIPFITHKRIYDLLNSSSEEEFFQVLESMRFNFNTNIVKVLESKLNYGENSELIDKVRILGLRYIEFSEEIKNHGFFGSFNDRHKNTSINFIDEYTSIFKWLTSKSFSSQVNNVIHLLINSFIMSDTIEDGVNYKGITGAIVSPFHPVMLEKIQAQMLYLREGAQELFKFIFDKENGSVDVEKYFSRLEQLSTITSGTDILISSENKEYLTTKNVFGYFALYGKNAAKSNSFSSVNLLNNEIVLDEDFSLKEFMRPSPISIIIKRSISDYLETFPSHIDGVKITFINPSQLQPIIAGVHEVVQELKSFKIKIKLQILVPSLKVNGTNYLRYWLDNFFSEDDDVEIKTFFKVYDLEKNQLEKHLSETIDAADIAFIQNILTIKSIDFDKAKKSKDLIGTRFPMVFYPLPVSKTSVHRKSTISQTQFEASLYHSQMIQQLENPFTPKDTYRVVKELELSNESEMLLNVIHEKANWVVCMDTGIDKNLIKLKNSRIISFSTGVGPFGELNVTTSAKEKIKYDITKKLYKRLHHKFPTWTSDELEKSAEYCTSISGTLDGACLLKALNPSDFKIHEFLAYVLTVKFLRMEDNDEKTLLSSLIPLDSYSHWFKEKGTKRPDFLYFHVSKNVLIEDTITINASLIECKLGNSSKAHIEGAMLQLDSGLQVLRELWNPGSNSIEKRYWFAQLYRALVFSKINLPDNSQDYANFTIALQRIIDGKFIINWDAKLLTFWLDYNMDTIGEEPMILGMNNDMISKHYSFGQLFIQKMLLPDYMQNKTFEYVNVTDEEDFTEIDETTEANDNSDRFNEEPEIDLAVMLNKKRGYFDNSNDLAEAGSVQSRTEVDEKSSNKNKEQDMGNNSTVNNLQRNEDINIDNVRVLIGEDIKTKEKIYWEYGHSDLPNRHILISGNSGQGKTYAIQCMLLELAQRGISNIIFDYTDGFTDAKLEFEFKDFLGDKIVQFPVYHHPFPINPFKKHDIEIAGIKTPQKDVDVAERIRSVLQSVYGFGDQQASAIYQATKNGLAKYKDKMNLEYLRKELELISSEISNAKTVLSKISALVDREPFDSVNIKDWGDLRKEEGTVFIVQLSGFTRDVQVLITEFILWDSWYYNVKNGKKEYPFLVVLDEAQNLDHSDTSPAAMILTEGRKFGWSGWFATQFMNEKLKKGGVQRLQQASQKIYFAPPEQDLSDTANAIEADKVKAKDWQITLSKLSKGECIVVGYALKNDRLEKARPRIVKITSLKERIL